MKCTYSTMTSKSGFTLVEIIATIVLMGILAAFFIHFMGTAISQSSKSMELVTSEAEAEGVMELIIAYYTSEINSDPDNALTTIATQISNGDLNEPADISISTDWIVFDSSGNEQTDTSGVNTNLKVTVEGPGHNLTTILTKSRVNASDPPVHY